MYLNFGKKNEVPGNYNKPFVLKSDNTSRGHFVEIEKNVPVLRRLKFNITIFPTKHHSFIIYLKRMWPVAVILIGLDHLLTGGIPYD